MFFRSSKSKPKKKRKETPNLTELMHYLCERGYTAYGFDDLSIRVHFPDSQDPLFSVTNDGKRYECLNLSPAPIFDTKYDVELFLIGLVNARPTEFSQKLIDGIKKVMKEEADFDYCVSVDPCDRTRLCIPFFGYVSMYEVGLLYSTRGCTRVPKYAYCEEEFFKVLRESIIEWVEWRKASKNMKVHSNNRVRAYSDDERLCDLPQEVSSDGIIAICNYILVNTGKKVTYEDTQRIKEYTIQKIRNAGGQRYMLDEWLNRYIDSPQEDKWSPRMFYNTKHKIKK